jgi:hypothetical protein
VHVYICPPPPPILRKAGFNWLPCEWASIVALASTIIQSKDIHMQKIKRNEKKRKMGTSRKPVWVLAKEITSARNPYLVLAKLASRISWSSPCDRRFIIRIRFLEEFTASTVLQ